MNPSPVVKFSSTPVSGDGIPDGWEIHFGLSPHNQSDNLVDLDLDGWDANRDGFISDDVSRNPVQLALGESLSSVEEYNVFLDDPNGDKTGTPVKAGLRSVRLQVLMVHWQVILSPLNLLILHPIKVLSTMTLGQCMPKMI